MERENATGFNSIDIDLYGFLNVSKQASMSEIKAAHKELALVTHPDKINNMIDQQENDDFKKAHKAYKYLINQQTRLIYDNYGIPGLIMFEKHKEDFRESGEKLREIDDKENKNND